MNCNNGKEILLDRNQRGAVDRHTDTLAEKRRNTFGIVLREYLFFFRARKAVAFNR